MADKQLRHTANGEKRYRVRWRDPSGKQKSKTFLRSKDADAFKLKTEVEAQMGTLSGESQESFAEFVGLELKDGRVSLTGGGWFERYRQSVRRSTFDRRVDTMQHLVEFMPLTFDRITPALGGDDNGEATSP